MEGRRGRVETLGGRKFLLVIIVLVASSVLLLGEFLTLEEFKEWANAVWLTISSYFAGNAGSKFARRERYRDR